MANSSSIASFKILNQDFIKLDRFNGTNFNHWKDNMFLLIALNATYFLNHKLEAFFETAQDATPKERQKVTKLKKKR